MAAGEGDVVVFWCTAALWYFSGFRPHPAITQALAAGEISPSWAREFCAWNDRLPADRRDDADAILVGAAAVGAELTDLAGLAQEMYERSCVGRPGEDDGDRLGDRGLWLDVTFRGAGRLTGDLTPGCAAALSAVLDGLGKKAGPEDTRTAAQRRHDALEEACRRLLAAGMPPGRTSRQLMVHITLAQLRGVPGAGHAEADWAAAAAREHGWLAGPEADAAACDATVVPIVTGHLDPAALDRLVDAFLVGHGMAGSGGVVGHRPADGGPVTSGSGTAGPFTGGPQACACRCGDCPCPSRTPLAQHTRQRLRRALLAMAAGVLSGPGGLAAHLRAGLGTAPLTSASLPLDIGAAAETIPAHLRRAATARHPQCAFPGCEQPAGACDIHHLIPRAEGGPTALTNLVPLCVFHHLIVIHSWGWTLTLHPDGTTTATSRDGRVLHSHSPPGRAA